MDSPTGHITDKEKPAEDGKGAASSVPEVEPPGEHIPASIAAVAVSMAAEEITAPESEERDKERDEEPSVENTAAAVDDVVQPEAVRVFKSPPSKADFLTVYLPDELIPKAAEIRQHCLNFVEFIHKVVNKTVYLAEPSDKFKRLVDVLHRGPKNKLVYYEVLRNMGVVQDPASNFGRVLKFSKFNRLCWNILDEWATIKTVKVQASKLSAVVSMLASLRLVMTSAHLLNKDYVHPEFYTNCVDILDKFSFHPEFHLRATANGELKRLRKAYCLRRKDSELSYQLSRKAFEKLLPLLDTKDAQLEDILKPVDMLSIISCCDTAQIEVFCRELLPKLFQFSSSRERVFDALNFLLTSRTDVLSFECIQSILTEMYNVHCTFIETPRAHNARAVVRWLCVMQEAHLNLYKLDVQAACEALPKFFQAVRTTDANKSCFRASPATASLRSTINDGVLVSLQTLFSQIVAPVCRSKELAAKHAQELSQCFDVITSDVRGTRYKASHVFAAMIESAGQNCADLWINKVADFKILGATGLGAAIRVLGTEMVLEKYPLEANNGDLDFNKKIMIDLLRENIGTSSIQCFLDKILPLAVYCQKCVKAEEKMCFVVNDHKQAARQLLELLPCFCTAAPDLEANFEHIAPIIYDFIKNRESLRPTGLSALRNCLIAAKTCKNKAALDAVRKFEKHFLPLLYDLYLTEPSNGEADRPMILECLKMLFVMSKTALTRDTIRKAVANLNVVTSDDAQTAYVKRSILRLFTALLPWMNVQLVRLIYGDYLKYLPEIEDEDERKHAYEFLKRILSYPKRGGCRSFVTSNRKKVRSLLWQCLQSPFLYTDRRERFKLLAYLMMTRPHANPRGVLANMVVRDALTTLNEARSVREKDLACDALICVFQCFLLRKKVNLFLSLIAYNLFIPEPDRDELKSEILAATCILKNFSAEIGRKNVALLFDAVINAMNVPIVAVLTAGMAFLRVYFGLLPAAPSPDTLRTFFQSLSVMPHNIKVFLRKHIEIAFVALLKRCHYSQLIGLAGRDDVLEDLVRRAHAPTKYHPAIRAMRDEFNHVTEPDEFLPKNTRLEDILTASDFTDGEDCMSEVDFDELLRRQTESDEDDLECYSDFSSSQEDPESDYCESVTSESGDVTENEGTADESTAVAAVEDESIEALQIVIPSESRNATEEKETADVSSTAVEDNRDSADGSIIIPGQPGKSTEVQETAGENTVADTRDGAEGSQTAILGEPGNATEENEPEDVSSAVVEDKCDDVDESIIIPGEPGKATEVQETAGGNTVVYKRDSAEGSQIATLGEPGKATEVLQETMDENTVADKRDSVKEGSQIVTAGESVNTQEGQETAEKSFVAVEVERDSVEGSQIVISGGPVNATEGQETADEKNLAAMPDSAEGSQIVIPSEQGEGASTESGRGKDEETLSGS